MTSHPLSVHHKDRILDADLQKRARTNHMRCLQCKACSSGCPFYEAMDLGPNRVIRLLQLGDVKRALTSSTIWICVGCDTCAHFCPMSIDIPALMDTLRQKTLELGLPVALPEVLELHREVLNSIERYGRTHKLEIMLRYKVKKKAWFEDMDLGMKMLRKRKLHLLPSRIEEIREVKELFANEIKSSLHREDQAGNG